MRKPLLIDPAMAVALISCFGPTPNASADTPTLTVYDVGARPRSIAVADLNGDKRLDVVVANAGDAALTLFFGAMGGQLMHSGTPIPAGNEPSDVDAIDLDNDGDVDLVVANHETSLVNVLLNDGDAQFAPAAGSPFDTGARPHLHGVATGDFDGDGWNDVAVESSGANEIRVLIGSQKGLSESAPIPAGTMPYYRLGAADVSGDGHVDVLIPGHGDNTVRVVHRKRDVLTLADWTIPLSGQPWMVVGDDLSGDGRADIAVVMTNAVEVWLADSTGFNPAPRSPFEIESATEVATGDIDGDGVADIAVGPWDGDEVTIITGRKFSTQTVRVCDRPVGLAIADLDGDGRGEVLAACATDSRLIVLTWMKGH